MFDSYINVEPTSGVSCTLFIDDGTVVLGAGQQHVEFKGIPDAVNGWGGWVEAVAAGYKDARVRVSVVPPALLTEQGEYVFMKLEKAAPQKIHIDGRHFRTADGAIWLWQMCDYYRGLAELRDQGEAHFRARLRYFKGFGFNGVRIYFAMHYVCYLHPLDDWSGHFAMVERAMQILAEEGLYAEWTGGDYQETLPQYDQQLNALNTMCDLIRRYPAAFLDWCNEAFKNGGIRAAIDNANRSGVLCTYGHPYQPVDANGKTPRLDYHAHATTRDVPKAFTDAAKMFWYGEGINDQGQRFDSPAPVFDQEGIGAAEVNIPQRRSNDPHLFYVMGKGSKAYGNGMTFHDDSYGSNWGPVTEQCARSCIEGLAT